MEPKAIKNYSFLTYFLNFYKEVCRNDEKRKYQEYIYTDKNLKKIIEPLIQRSDVQISRFNECK